VYNIIPSQAEFYKYSLNAIEFKNKLNSSLNRGVLMEEFLGVFVDPWNVKGARHDKIHDALYGFDEKCVVSENAEKYGVGRFDLVDYDDFSEYWSSTESDNILVAGDLESTVDFISEIDVSSEDLAFERYTISGIVERPHTKEVLYDEIRSMFPFQERKSLVDENTAYKALEEMGVPEADVVSLTDVASPQKDSHYYSDTLV